MLLKFDQWPTCMGCAYYWLICLSPTFEAFGIQKYSISHCKHLNGNSIFCVVCNKCASPQNVNSWGTDKNVLLTPLACSQNDGVAPWLSTLYGQWSDRSHRQKSVRAGSPQIVCPHTTHRPTAHSRELWIISYYIKINYFPRH